MSDDGAVPARLTRRGLVAAGGVGALALATGHDRAAAAPLTASGAEVAPGLTIHPRSDWDMGKLLAKRAMPAEDVKFLIVHHSAGGNTYAQSNVPARLRSGYAYHTSAHKHWPDICYNFLIDRFGGVWEGRTGSLAGPVMGDASGGSQGFAQLVCLLGNFTTTMPSPAALASLTRTLAWLADRFDLDTTPGATTQFVSRGSNRWKKGVIVTARTIVGHREMSKTACPGDQFFPYVHDQLQQVVHAARTT